MPNIQEYNATGEITPSDRGIQAAELAGRRIGLFYHQIGSDIKDVSNAVEQHMTVMETSELYKSGAQLEFNVQKKWEHDSALPENRNNPHFGDQFMQETVQPLLDQWGKGASTDRGKELVATMGSQIKNNIFRHVASGQAAMDTAHWEENKSVYLNTLGAQLIDDPSEQHYKDVLGSAEQFIQDGTAHISDVEERERIAASDIKDIRTQLTMARYRGVGLAIEKQIGQTGDETKSTAKIQADEEVAKRFGFEYLDPEQQQAVTKEVTQDAVTRGQDRFKSNDATQRRQQDEAIEGELLKVDTAMFKDNGAGGVTIQTSPELRDRLNQIATLPGAERHAEAIKSTLEALRGATQDQIEGKERTTDHGVYTSLFDRVGSTTNPLTKAEVDQQQKNLSNKDWQDLRDMASDSKLQQPRVNHAITQLNQWIDDTAKPLIVKSDPRFGTLDQGQVAQFGRFKWDAQNKFRLAVAAGEDPQHAVDRLTDPHDPKSFWPFIPQYQSEGKSSTARIIQSLTTGNPQQLPPTPGGITHAPPPKRLPNESPEDYDKRVHH